MRTDIRSQEWLLGRIVARVLAYMAGNRRPQRFENGVERIAVERPAIETPGDQRFVCLYGDGIPRLHHHRILLRHQGMLNEHLSLLDIDPGSVVLVIDGNGESGRAMAHDDRNRRADSRREGLIGGQLGLHPDPARGDIEQILRISRILPKYRVGMREKLETRTPSYAETRVPIITRENRLCNRNVFCRPDRPVLAAFFCRDLP